MTTSDRIPVAVMALWFIAWVALLIAVLAADGPDPCEIDAPMEQAQCRANGSLMYTKRETVEVNHEKHE